MSATRPLTRSIIQSLFRAVTSPAAHSLGPELTTNGGFTTDTGWTKGSGWTIAGDVAARTNVGSATILGQSIALVAGVAYRVEVVISSRTSGSISPRFSGGTLVTGTAISATGSTVMTITALAGNTTLELLGSSSWAGSVDSVSVRAL